jgi:hypothetical protein
MIPHSLRWNECREFEMKEHLIYSGHVSSRSQFITATNEEENVMNSILTVSGEEYVRQVIHGEIPRVLGIGIMSVETTAGVSNPSETIDRRTILNTTLRKENYTFMQIRGLYGNLRDPFIIINIDKQSMIRFLKSYEQESIIHATVIDGSAIEFNLLGRSGALGTGRVSLDAATGERITEFDGQEFCIPIFGNPTNDGEVLLKNVCNPNRLSYTLTDILHLKMTDELVNDIKTMFTLNEWENGLEYTKSTLLKRGQMLLILRRLHAMFADLNGSSDRSRAGRFENER